MRSLTIRGRLDRHDIRQLIRNHGLQASIADINRMNRLGMISANVRDRYERLWLWSLEVQHPDIRHVSEDRWRSRRARIRQAVRNMPYPPRAA